MCLVPSNSFIRSVVGGWYLIAYGSVWWFYRRLRWMSILHTSFRSRKSMRPSSCWKPENACGRLFLWNPKFALKPTSIFLQRVLFFLFFFFCCWCFPWVFIWKFWKKYIRKIKVRVRVWGFIMFLQVISYLNFAIPSIIHPSIHPLSSISSNRPKNPFAHMQRIPNQTRLVVSNCESLV